MRKIEDNLIVNMTFDFALQIMSFGESLEKNKRWIIANQIVRSVTSIGANVREAQNAESKADFLHKFKIAAKEAEETLYWLQLCQASTSYPDCLELIDNLRRVKKVLNKIISTTKLSKKTLANPQIS